jgi:hypothetical protein
MQGQQANNIAGRMPNAPIPVPSNPFQNLAQTQAGAQAANANLQAGGPGSQPGFIDNISKMFGQQGQQGGLLSQGSQSPQFAPPPPPPLMQGQQPNNLLSQLLQNRGAPLVGGSGPANAANNFNGMGMSGYLTMMRAMGG